MTQEDGMGKRERQWYMIGVDGVETFDTAKEAEAWALGALEPEEYGEIDPDIGCVEWGELVPRQVARVVVDGNVRDAAWAREQGYDAHWDVSLEDVPQARELTQEIGDIIAAAWDVVNFVQMGCRGLPPRHALLRAALEAVECPRDEP